MTDKSVGTDIDAVDFFTDNKLLHDPTSISPPCVISARYAANRTTTW